MNKEVTFNIKVTMNERWVNDFCSMLKYMETCGDIGHSSLIGFYADGDGDFHPIFEFDREYEETSGYRHTVKTLEVIFDAGQGEKENKNNEIIYYKKEND